MAELSSELSKELDKLRKALQSGKNDVVAFVGAGLSSPPLPSWRELLEGLAGQPSGEAARARLAEGTLLEAASALEAAVPRPELEKALAAHARSDAPRPAIYKALAALPLQHYLTGNRDGWLSGALADKLGSAPQTFVPGDSNALADLLPQAGPTVVLLHGDAARPETLVLAEAGYKTLGKAPRSYAAAIKGLVGGRKFFFAGGSPRDPDVAALLLEWADLFSADEAAGLGAPRHFFLGSGLGEEDKAHLFKLRIRPIELGAASLEQAIAHLSGTAPTLGSETATRALPRPASVAAAAAKPEPAPAPAPAPPKEKYDPLARVKAAESEASLKALALDVKRLEEELVAAKLIAGRLPALEGELTAAKTSLARLPALEEELVKLRAHDAEATKLEEEIADAFDKRDADATRLEGELAAAQAELAAARAELAPLKARPASGENDLATARAELAAARAELAPVKARATSLEAELAAARAELAPVKARATSLEAELTTARSELGLAQTAKVPVLEPKAVDPKAAASELTPLRTRIAELESLLAAGPAPGAATGDTAKRAESLEARIAELAETRRELEASRRKLETEKAELQQRNGQLEGERARQEGERQKFEAQRIKLESRVRELEEKVGAKPGAAEAKLQAVEAQRAALDKRATVAELDLESERTTLKALKATADAERTRLQDELAKERSRPPSVASKIPLVVGALVLLLGLGAAGVAIYQPALLDPLRSALGAGGGSLGTGGGR